MFKISLLVVIFIILPSCASVVPVEKLSASGSTGKTDTFHNKNNLGGAHQTTSITTGAAKIAAHISIFLAQLVASDAAKVELNKFRSGEHDSLPVIYTIESSESAELLEGSYYQQLTRHLIEELARWYDSKIPHSGGLFSQANTFRVFDGTDFLTEIVDGIDMADIIGSITYYVRVTTHSGKIHFHAINKMSLESFSGENYFRHGLVKNPQNDAFKSTTQIFNWSTPIPEEYRQ